MPLPTAVDLRRGITNWLPLGNLSRNDCTIAAYEHVNMVKNLAASSWWKRLAYKIGYRPPSNSYAISEYVDFLATLNERPGAGVAPSQFLAWEKQQGRISDYTNLDIYQGNANDIIRQGMIDWTGCLLVLELTKRAYWLGDWPGKWELVGNDKPLPSLVHAVAMVGYGPLNNIIITWGIAKQMTIPFTEVTVIECWVWR